MNDADREIVERLRSWQERALPWLPECGTVCQCQGEHDCELKSLRREAARELRRFIQNKKTGDTPDLSARDRRFLANYLRIPKEEQCDA